MMTKPLFPNVLMAFCSLFLIFSCGREQRPTFTPAERREADSIVKQTRGVQSLDSLYTIMCKKQNVPVQMAALSELGKQLRNESRYDEALEKHGKELALAEQCGDTLEKILALNNIGTDYRRMGIYDAALLYHKTALMIADEFSDTTFKARKNRVVSLNGLANVYLSVNSYQKADSCLRQALQGEKALHSLTGQAINCANLGSIFMKRGQTDSAWVYFHKSMMLNKQGGNTLGIAICHNNFGNLYEKEHRPDKALAEYNTSLELLKTSKDAYHTLNTLTSLAGLYVNKGDEKQAKFYLQEAHKRAAKIHSSEHLSEIYILYYQLHKNRGEYQRALAAKEKATALEDSLINIEKINRMQSAAYNIEQGKFIRQMAAANHRLESEKSARLKAYVIFAVIIFLLSTTIGLLFYSRKLRARSYHELKKLNHVRDAFFRNITHEFRTPLTVILGLSHDLQQESTTEEEVKDLGTTIERQGNHMLKLINQLLDLSKLRSASTHTEWKNGNIVAYISMIVESFEAFAAGQNIKLQFISRTGEIIIDFVPDYVSKIMNNLISNALKFTAPSGKINISLWQSREHLHIDVSDTGRGIPPESLPHIFEEFYQSDNVPEGIGTDVGLALVYQIVKQLEGTITVDSTEGIGTTFHLAWPIRKAKAPAIDWQELKEEVKEPEIEDVSANETLGQAEEFEHTVLVVEDNADVAKYIGRHLGNKYHVFFAQNGEEGLDLARRELPDAIVTDLMMPGMDGMELTRRLRADELTSHIPIIIVTAKVTDADRIEGSKAGADAYLTKPFNSDELLACIENLMHGRARLREKFAHLSITTNDPTVAAQGTKKETASPDVHFIHRVTDSIYVILNSRRPVDVGAVADRMNMSYSQLYRKLQALTGLTPVQYIQRVKVAKAKRMLLAHPEMPLNIIAEQCGFSDYSNFVRAFRNQLGQTPTQFIRSDKDS